MTNGWMWIIGIMLIGGFILQMTPLMFYLYAVFGVHLSILLISYLILRRERGIDLRANMLFMLGLTVINVMTDLGIMNYHMSWAAVAALFVWSLFGGGRRG